MSQQEKVIHEIAAEVEQQSTQEGEVSDAAGSGGRGEAAMERKKQHLVWKILFLRYWFCSRWRELFWRGNVLRII